MDLEEMKRQWSELNARVDKTGTNINQQKLNNMKTAQQQLINKYRTFSGLSATFCCLSSVIFIRLIDNVWLGLGFTFFFAVCAVMDFVLQRKVGDINLATMTVTEVAQKGISCRKLHHIFQIILITLGIVLIAYLAYVMTGNKAAIYGMCIGGAVGLAIGLKTYFKMMDNYKDLIQN